MKFLNNFKELTKFERLLWSLSITIVALSFMFSPEKDYLSLTASLMGITALIFVAKGFVIGQVLTVVFAVFYGIISIRFNYYGEMITYLFMTSPMALLAAIEWIRNSYKDTGEVRVTAIDKRQIGKMLVLAVAVTVVFYFILRALNTSNLFFSTLSVTTSFLASYLTFMRSPYYALAYAANDVILIVLWTLAATVNIAYLTMIICFVVFLANDIYGFINWRYMQNRQGQKSAE